MECAYYFASLNGIAFTAQPQAPAFVLAGAGWSLSITAAGTLLVPSAVSIDSGGDGVLRMPAS